MPPRIPDSSGQAELWSGKSRRAFLYVTMTGLGVGACSIAWWMRTRSSRDDRTSPAPPPRGSMAWAEQLLAGDDEAILASAGDLERLAMRESGHEELFGALFQRVFQLALADLSERADLAAACALRGLERLGRLELVADRIVAMQARSDLREANALWSRFRDRRRR